MQTEQQEGRKERGEVISEDWEAEAESGNVRDTQANGSITVPV
jgi:hypothetical protein